jgi:hypothetical protein
MISPDARQYSPLSGGKSTYRSVQFSRASSIGAAEPSSDRQFEPA